MHIIISGDVMLGMGMNPKQMQALFKQLGIKTKEIDAKRVIIETDSGKIIITNPKVTQIDMKGVTTFQVSGDIEEESFSEDDVKFVMEQTGKSKEEARKALEETNGDVAEAIIKLNGG